MAELVSNSYDADAKTVKIIIDYDTKEVKVSDDGHGMTFQELNDNFLVIGKNRRSDGNNGYSRKGRKVTGKKGLGKLAVFGIAEEINISSVSNNIKNEFSMNYQEIKSNQSDEIYKPDIIHNNESTEENNGTTIVIKNISTNNVTPMATLAENLSTRFKLFDTTFKVIIIDKNTKEELVVTNELYYNKMDKEFEWDFPQDFLPELEDISSLKWLNDAGVTGKLVTQRTPLQKKHSGFIIYSRNKLVQENTFFSDRSNDNFNSYVTGHFTADFIDDDLEMDYVSTDRKSLLWDQNNQLNELKNNLHFLVITLEESGEKKELKKEKRRFKKQSDRKSVV